MTTQRTVGAIAVVALVLSTLPSPARAAPDEPKHAEARLHFETGRNHHKLGRFSEAIDEYSKSYELVPLPGVLFNIGQCHRNLKDDERALFFFERYLKEAPDAQDRQQVEALIAELRTTIEKRGDAEVRSDPQPPPPPPPPPEEKPIRTDLVPPPMDEPEPGLHERWWFWAIIGAGAVAATVGVVVVTGSGTPDGSIGTIDARLAPRPFDSP